MASLFIHVNTSIEQIFKDIILEQNSPILHFDRYF